MRFDMLDFPTAWEIQRQERITHHEHCSSVPGWHPLSGPGFLCDCGAVEREWERLKAQNEQEMAMVQLSGDAALLIRDFIAENWDDFLLHASHEDFTEKEAHDLVAELDPNYVSS